MEEIEAVTESQLSSLRSKFASRVSEDPTLFDPRDLSRVNSDSLWLRRFIAHGEGSVETALTLLVDCVKWRKSFGVNDLSHTFFPADLLSKGTLFIRGQDKWGKKLLVFKAKTHLKGSVPMDTLQKMVVYYFERIERESRSNQVSIIFDMKDTGWNNMDMDFVKYLITLLKTYYPYFVNYLVIFEMPWLLNAAWKIIKGWLPPKFVDRVKFQDKKNLSEFIEVKHQLKEWGGEDNYTFQFVPEDSVIKKEEEDEVVRLKNSSSSSRDDEQQQRTMSPIPPSHNHQQSPSGGELAEVDDRLVFRATADDNGGDYNYIATLRVRNVSSRPIAVKIKTTTPERYRVRPIVSVISGGEDGVVTVTTHPGVLASAIARDRFLAQVVSIQDNNNNSDAPSLFKQASSGGATTKVETYRVAVTAEPRPGEPNTTSGPASGGGMVSLSDERLKRGLEELEAKVAERVATSVAIQVKQIRREALFLFGCAFAVVFVAFFFAVNK